jgi:hypothetical protein
MEMKINLSENVRVSDPCYTDDVWCKTQLKNVLPGSYNCKVAHSDEGAWGVRISSITLVHENYTDDESLEWNYHSDIGVDSGQAGVFCETSYRNDEVAAGITTPEVDFMIPQDDAGDAWYTKMCKFTLGGEGYGAYDTGLVSCSGIGDGSYPLYVVYDRNDKIIGMQIDYLLGDEEDEEEYEGDVCGVCGNDLEDGESCNCSND